MVANILRQAFEILRAHPNLFIQFAFWHFMIHGLNLLALNRLSTTGVTGGFWFITMVAFLMVQVMLFHALGQIMKSAPEFESADGQPEGINIGAAMTWGLRHWWRFMFAQMLYGLLVVGGLVVFLIPGIYLAVVCSLAAIIAVMQPCGILESFSLSQQWLKPFFWPVMGLGALMFGIGILSAFLGHPVLVLVVQACFGVYKSACWMLLFSAVRAQATAAEIEDDERVEEG